jgi:hypothetical protein
VEAEGRVAKQVGGCGYFAAVRVRLDPGASAPVALEPAAVSDYDRGSGWGEAASIGAALGLSLCGAVGRCAVTNVRGTVCDTSPALVAIAAARAVWAAAGFEPPAALAARVESCVLRGHKLSPEQLGSELAAGSAPDAAPGTLGETQE